MTDNDIETQTIAVSPQSSDSSQVSATPPVEPARLIDLVLERDIDPGETFAILIEAPTSQGDDLRPAFALNKFEVTTGTAEDVAIFGIYIDRLPSVLGQYPLPAEAFSPTNPQQGQIPFGNITPFSLVEIIGKNFGSVAGKLKLHIQGPIVPLAQLQLAHERASLDWFAASHAQALQRTIDALTATASTAATETTT